MNDEMIGFSDILFIPPLQDIKKIMFATIHKQVIILFIAENEKYTAQFQLERYRLHTHKRGVVEGEGAKQLLYLLHRGHYITINFTRNHITADLFDASIDIPLYIRPPTYEENSMLDKAINKVLNEPKQLIYSTDTSFIF